MEHKGQKHPFRGLCKDVFNRVRNHKNAHDLWLDICALHEVRVSVGRAIILL
jgi:hypothetical protein